MIVVAGVLFSPWATPAATAQASELADVGWWWTTGGGYSHCTQDYNHYRCDSWHPWLGWVPGSVDVWVPSWCQFAGVSGGDGWYDPMRIRFASADPAQSCITFSDGWRGWYNQFYAWWDGGGGLAGQAWWDPQTVVARSWQVPFRDSAWAQGTIIEVH